MKRACIITVLFALLCSLVISLSGCTMEQPGETTAEGHRRHIRNVRLNNQQFNQDLDSFLLFDKPSKLSDKTIN